MPSIINSDNGAVSGSAGLKFDSADDGILHIQNSGNTAIAISSGGIATFTQPPLTAMPAFRAYLSTTQSVTSSVATKVNINTVTIDTNNWFDTTNYRYTPQIAGYYLILGIVRCGGTSMTAQGARIYKNGSEYTIGDLNRVSTSNPISVSVSDIIYLNGSTDYVELYGFVTASSGAEFNYSSPSISSFLSGFLVRAT